MWGLVQAAADPHYLVEPKTVRGNAWRESVELLEALGLELDDWQELIMQTTLGERHDGTWAAKRVGLSVPRQNGKSQMIVARALVGALLFGDRKIIVSAHLQDTARETFSKFMDVIEGSPELESKLRGGSIDKGVWNAMQREQITFANGSKIQFKARTRSGTRGYSCDVLFLDEAQMLAPAAWVSINSTMSARPNPQVWLMGTPPTPDDDGEVFTKFRQSALDGTTTTAAYLEWSADPDDDPALESTRAKANPAWWTRINHDVVDGEYDTYSVDEFALDRLGIWAVGGNVPRVINKARWDALAIPAEGVPSQGNTAYGVKFSVDGMRYGLSVALAGDELAHVEALSVTPMGAGLTALADWLTERWRTCGAIVIDGKAGTADLVNLLRARGVPEARIIVAGIDVAVAANQTLLRMVTEGTLTHSAQQGLDDSVGAAAKRVIGQYGGWGFEPATLDADVTPTESVALALYGATKTKRRTLNTGQGRTMGNRTTGAGRRRAGSRV